MKMAKNNVDCFVETLVFVSITTRVSPAAINDDHLMIFGMFNINLRSKDKPWTTTANKQNIFHQLHRVTFKIQQHYWVCPRMPEKQQQQQHGFV